MEKKTLTRILKSGVIAAPIVLIGTTGIKILTPK